MNPLEIYFRNNKDRIIHRWTPYFEVYRQHFQRYRNKACVILEIGVSMGGSLQMWKHYVGPKVQIYAIDIDSRCKQFEDESTKNLIGSQSDRQFLRQVKKEIQNIDSTGVFWKKEKEVKSAGRKDFYDKLIDRKKRFKNRSESWLQVKQIVKNGLRNFFMNSDWRI